MESGLDEFQGLGDIIEPRLTRLFVCFQDSAGVSSGPLGEFQGVDGKRLTLKRPDSSILSIFLEL